MDFGDEQRNPSLKDNIHIYIFLHLAARTLWTQCQGWLQTRYNNIITTDHPLASLVLFLITTYLYLVSKLFFSLYVGEMGRNLQPFVFVFEIFC